MSSPLNRSALGSSTKGNENCPFEEAQQSTPTKRASEGLAKSLNSGTPGSVGCASKAKRWQAPTMSSLAKVVGSIRSVGRDRGKVSGCFPAVRVGS